MTVFMFYQQANEHKERINDVCYCESKETVYSGSNDKYIIEWSYPSMQLKWYELYNS